MVFLAATISDGELLQRDSLYEEFGGERKLTRDQGTCRQHRYTSLRREVRA